MYFYVVYGGARRRYGGAGRNSPGSITNSGPISTDKAQKLHATYYCSKLAINHCCMKINE